MEPCVSWENRDIRLRPVGIVRNGILSPTHSAFDQVISEIRVREDLSEALDGLEDYSHVIVITWMDQVSDEKRSIRKLHPKDRRDLPLVGVFATRTQYRPNPIGLKAVRLLSRNDNVLRVEGLDAIDGTPVLDIKPYSPRQDLIPEAVGPEWLSRL